MLFDDIALFRMRIFFAFSCSNLPSVMISVILSEILLAGIRAHSYWNVLKDNAEINFYRSNVHVLFISFTSRFLLEVGS